MTDTICNKIDAICNKIAHVIYNKDSTQSVIKKLTQFVIKFNANCNKSFK